MVSLHAGLQLWGVAALVGPCGVGKTRVRRAFMNSIKEIQTPAVNKSFHARPDSVIRKIGRRASVSTPKGRRSSIIFGTRTTDLNESIHYIFPSNLTMRELYGATTDELAGGWIEGLLGHTIKMLKEEMIVKKAEAALVKASSSTAGIPRVKAHYLVVDGCRRCGVFEVLLDMVVNNALKLPNGEEVSIVDVPIFMLLEMTDVSWVSPSHISRIGLVVLGLAKCSGVSLPGIFINTCNSISENVHESYHLSLVDHVRELSAKLTILDILGVLPHRKRNNQLQSVAFSDPDKVVQCATAAANILKAILTVVYNKGERSFNDEPESSSVPLSNSANVDTVPEPSLVAKAVLTYAILWARRSFISNPEHEPTKGLLTAWIDDIGEVLPLAVRRMRPLHMINESGLLLVSAQMRNTFPVLESHGMISFCHLSGMHQGAAYLLSVLCKVGMHALVTGPSRSGKTAMVRAVTASLAVSESFYGISCLLDPRDSHKLAGTITETFSAAKSRKKNALSGIAGKSRVAIILDDVALADPDPATAAGGGASYDNALSGRTIIADSLRSLLCESGFHDMTTLIWRHVQNFNIIMTSRTSGVSPNIPFTLEHHNFCPIHVEAVASMELQELYCTVLRHRVWGGSTEHSHTAKAADAITRPGNGLIEPLVKATMAVKSIYMPMRRILGLAPANIDPMLLKLFPKDTEAEFSPPEDLGGPDDTEASGLKYHAQVQTLHKSQQWFKLTRIAFGDQCSSRNSIDDLEDTMKDNLHSALGMYGKTMRMKNRRLSAIDRAVMIATSPELESALDSVIQNVPPILDRKSAPSFGLFNSIAPSDRYEVGSMHGLESPPLVCKDATESVHQLIAAGALESRDAFKAIVSALGSHSLMHVLVSTPDSVVGLGLVFLALRNYPSTQLK